MEVRGAFLATFVCSGFLVEMPSADKASKEDVHVLHKRLLVDVLVVTRTVEHEFENRHLHFH